ncbi:MAG: GDP-mannose 4,6-dehydratase [Actinomycetota bacterium]|nr:GDP-mannose 4,6-dehydratase [Actinomycetota bacterium]
MATPRQVMTSGTDVVTGGAGFVGSELVSQLAASGRRVIVIDDLSTGHREHLDGLGPGPVELVRCDVRDAEAVGACLRGVDTVYHLACVNLRRSLVDPEAAHAVNATGTVTVLEAARTVAPRRVVHVSSSEVYGSARTVPMDEDHPTYPTTPYGASKLAGEAYARAYGLSFGLPVVVVRPFNAYGPRAHHEGNSGEVIPLFVRNALARQPLTIFGDGCQTRDFTHVADIAAGIRRAGTIAGIVGATFNLGSGREISVDDLARLVVDTFGGSSTPIERQAPRPGDVRRLCADASSAAHVLGFAPSRSLREGIAEIAAHHRMGCPAR